MRTLTQALESFRRDLVQHLQRGPADPVECEAGIAEDGVAVVTVVTFSDGEHLCSSFDLVPGESFGEDAREFVEFSFTLLAVFEAGLLACSIGPS